MCSRTDNPKQPMYCSYKKITKAYVMVKKEAVERALVISGGGSKGAFAGGIAAYLLDSCSRDYQLFVGTSAGSLLAPLLALGETERLKRTFTSICQQDIFNISPFIIKKSQGQFTYRINHFNTVRMFLKRKKTFGESKNLKHLIRQSFTPEDYRRLRISKKEVVVTVSNFSTNQVEYHSLKDNSYEDFCDWMWISANAVPFMSLVVKDGMEYADGGFGNYLPLQEAVKRGAKEIDAIILTPMVGEPLIEKPAGNAFSLMVRAFIFMLQQISLGDIHLGQLESLHRKITVNCYHTPRELTENSFIFDPEQMKAWWEEGFKYATETAPVCQKINVVERIS